MAELDWQDLEAIKRLKYKYQRCLDTKQWDELRESLNLIVSQEAPETVHF